MAAMTPAELVQKLHDGAAGLRINGPSPLSGALVQAAHYIEAHEAARIQRASVPMRPSIETSLRVGIDTESNDPDLAWIVGSLTERQITWISAWLAGEGFVLDR